MAELTRSIFANPRFVGSYAKIDQTPSDSLCEIAFAGRSNAGKSSVLNALFNRKSLVKVSSKPGKTRLLNFFETEKQHYIVDLPGYGYAAVSQSMQKEWGREMTRYLEERESLVGVVVVMDIRHPLSKMDLVMIDFLKENPDLRVHILLNKSDKLKRGPAANTLKKAENQLKAIMRCTIQTFSAQKRDGVPILQKQLLQWFNEK